MAYRAVPRTVRRIVRDRAGNRCKCCCHHAGYACAPFVCEHILPRVHGAGNTASELAWACAACNGQKYAKTHARDPETGRTIVLFNPRRQHWSRHFTWSEDYLSICGKTATGRATIEALHMNRPELINLRRALIAIGEHPPAAE